MVVMHLVRTTTTTHTHHTTPHHTSPLLPPLSPNPPTHTPSPPPLSSPPPSPPSSHTHHTHTTHTVFLVFVHFALYFPSCGQAQDARHHGRYEPEGHLCGMVLVVQTAENCGFSTVAVLRWSSIFLSWCRGRFPWSCCSADHSYFPVAVHEQGDQCLWYAGRAGSSSRCQLCATTGAFHSCSTSTRSSSSLSRRRGISPCSSCSADPRGSTVAVHVVVDVPVALVVQILRCRRGEDSRAPTVAAH